MKRNIKLSILSSIILVMFFSVSCGPEYRARRHNENEQHHNDRDRHDRDHDDDHH